MRFPWGVKLLLGIVTAVVLAAVGLGIYIGDSPSESRAVRLDQQRVRDLQGIDRAVKDYWEENEELPQTLDALKDAPARVRTVSDPVTGERYEHRALEGSNYELCAVFETDSSKGRFGVGAGLCGRKMGPRRGKGLLRRGCQAGGTPRPKVGASPATRVKLSPDPAHPGLLGLDLAPRLSKSITDGIIVGLLWRT